MVDLVIKDAGLCRHVRLAHGVALNQVLFIEKSERPNECRYRPQYIDPGACAAFGALHSKLDVYKSKIQHQVENSKPSNPCFDSGCSVKPSSDLFTRRNDVFIVRINRTLFGLSAQGRPYFVSPHTRASRSGSHLRLLFVNMSKDFCDRRILAVV